MITWYTVELPSDRKSVSGDCPSSIGMEVLGIALNPRQLRSAQSTASFLVLILLLLLIIIRTTRTEPSQISGFPTWLNKFQRRILDS